MPFQLAFPCAISPVAHRVYSLLLTKPHSGCPAFEVVVAGERLCVPGRIYTDKATVRSLLAASNADAALLAACLGTRDADGHVREACLRRLQGSRRAWVAPFVVALLGDYVVEIAELATVVVRSLDADSLTVFIRGNTEFFALTRSRAVSYWNCYYRHRNRDYRSYPPVATLDAITLAAIGRVLEVPGKR